MIIAIEIDRLISDPIFNYMALGDVAKVKVQEGAKEALDKIKSIGHTIKIYTSRDASLGPETQVWLQKNKIPYDVLICNKPRYDILLDPKSAKFEKWEDFLESYKYWLGNSA